MPENPEFFIKSQLKTGVYTTHYSVITSESLPSGLESLSVLGFCHVEPRAMNDDWFLGLDSATAGTLVVSPDSRALVQSLGLDISRGLPSSYQDMRWLLRQVIRECLVLGHAVPVHHVHLRVLLVIPLIVDVD